MPPSLEERIASIEARNAKVESDKAWETSLFRRLAIMGMTYLASGVTLSLANMPYAWLSAAIPAIAYAFSTLTLPYLRTVWQKGKKN
jgi:hypothetical protein